MYPYESSVTLAGYLGGIHFGGFYKGMKDAFTLTAQQQYKKSLTGAFLTSSRAMALAVTQKPTIIGGLAEQAEQSGYKKGLSTGNWLKNALRF